MKSWHPEQSPKPLTALDPFCLRNLWCKLDLRQVKLRTRHDVNQILEVVDSQFFYSFREYKHSKWSSNKVTDVSLPMSSEATLIISWSLLTASLS